MKKEISLKRIAKVATNKKSKKTAATAKPLVA
jgi:hypothetical protein